MNSFISRRVRQQGLLAFAISNVLFGTSFAQDVSNATTASINGNLDTVVVTGARASGRTVENSAAPIDVVSSDDLLATGKGNLLEALQTLLPSFNSAARQSDLEGNI